MESILVLQGKKNIKIEVTKRTVDWLIKNTKVEKFDPISFSGYQRTINDKHCEKIVKYLKESDFYLPTSIVCVGDAKSNKLKIVDGQHRVHAFEMIQNDEPDLYNRIKNCEMVITILSGISLKDEIETFITINKTSRKVDTSLALVLKSKLYDESENNSYAAKLNYLCVELASILNTDDKSIWFNNISFEGFNKSMHKFISLNSFVKAAKRVVSALADKGIINLNWKTEQEIKDIMNSLCCMYNSVYESNINKWIQLYINNDLNILCGSIGVTVSMKILAGLIKEKIEVKTIDDAIKEYNVVLRKSNVKYNKWLSTDEDGFSKYSSESGYTFIAEIITGKVQDDNG